MTVDVADAAGALHPHTERLRGALALRADHRGIGALGWLGDAGARHALSDERRQVAPHARAVARGVATHAVEARAALAFSSARTGKSFSLRAGRVRAHSVRADVGARALAGARRPRVGRAHPGGCGAARAVVPQSGTKQQTPSAHLPFAHSALELHAAPFALFVPASTPPSVPEAKTHALPTHDAPGTQSLDAEATVQVVRQSIGVH